VTKSLKGRGGGSHSLLWYQYVIVFCMNEWGHAFTLYCVTFYLEWRVHGVEGKREVIPLFLHATQNLITICLCIRCRFPLQIQYAYGLIILFYVMISMLWTNNFVLFPDSMRYGPNYFILFPDSICYGLNYFMS